MSQYKAEAHENRVEFIQDLLDAYRESATVAVAMNSTDGVHDKTADAALRRADLRWERLRRVLAGLAFASDIDEYDSLAEALVKRMLQAINSVFPNQIVDPSDQKLLKAGTEAIESFFAKDLNKH